MMEETALPFMSCSLMGGYRSNSEETHYVACSIAQSNGRDEALVLS